MARGEPGLGQLGAHVRDAHLEVADAADLQRARQRFNDTALGQLGQRAQQSPAALPRRAWPLLVAATLVAAVAAAAVFSRPKGAPVTHGSLLAPSAVTSGSLTSVESGPAGSAVPPQTAALPEPSSAPPSPLATVHKGTSAVGRVEAPLGALPPAEQREKLLAERRAAASSVAASSAAFRLGRLEADYLGNPGEAAKWFAIYLAEQPRGPRRGDARGRLFECLWQSGQRSAASAQAQQYLLEYPGGPYAARARHILSP